MNKRFLYLLFAFLLLCAQALTAAHAVEHALEGESHEHVCKLCLAAHHLGNALPTATLALALLAITFAFAARRDSGRTSLPAPQPRQQSPPLL